MLKRLWLAARLLAACALVALVAPLWAAEPDPDLLSITTANDYQSVTLTFATGVFPLDPSGDPLDEEDLTEDHFAVSGTTAEITGVARGATSAIWTVQFLDPVVPHATVLSVVGDIGNSAAAVTLSEPVPFSGADLAALSSAIRNLVLIPARDPVAALGVDLPFVQDWLAHDRDLSGLIAGLPALPSAPPTEAQLVEFLAGLQDGEGNNILQLDFDRRKVTVAFNPDATASRHPMRGVAGVGEAGGQIYDLSLEGTLDVGVSLGGAVVLDVDGAVDVEVGADRPAVLLRTGDPYTATGRLGVVGISATATVHLDATITVDALSPPVVTPSGTAQVDVTEVRVTDTALVFEGPALLSALWPSLGEPLVCEGGTPPELDGAVPFCWVPAPPPPPDGPHRCEDRTEPEQVGGQLSCRDQPLDNVEVLADAFDSSGLRNFTRMAVSDVIAGLAWFTSWLTAVEEHGEMGEDLPIVGGSIGDLAQLATVLARPVLALSEITAISGDISAQGLVDVCRVDADQLDDLIDEYADALEITDETELAELRVYLHGALAVCKELLDDITITAEEIEFKLSVTTTRNLFNGQDPSLNLDLGDDLAGISLSATTGQWDTAQATTSFDLTFGIKLVPGDQLGIEPPPADPDAPLMSHRFYVKAGEVAGAAIDIEGTGLGVGARLGFLDLSIVGDLAADPVVGITFRDPGVGTGTPKEDGKIDLYEMAQAADNGGLGSLIMLQVGGDIDAAFTLTNPILFPSPRQLQVSGPFAALGNDTGEVFAFHNDVGPGWAFDAGRINVGHNLAETLELKAITPAQAIRMIVAITEQIAAMAGTDAMSQSVPFVDVRFQEAVDFATSFAEIARRVEERNPQDISSLEAALNEALGAVGMPSEVSVGVTAEELTLSFSASRTATRSYPFSFEGGGLSFAPADGGASVTATAGVEFNPQIGMLFEGESLDDRLFLRSAGMTFHLLVDADAFGTVYLGPLTSAIEGRAEIGDSSGAVPQPAELVVGLSGADAAGRITLGHLRTSLSEASSVGDVLSVEYSGRVFGSLGITTALGTGTVTVTGDLADPGAIEVVPNLNFEFALDLGTLVHGTIETSRFVGRLLEQSEVVTADLPLIGSELRTLVTVGADLRAAAEELDRLWNLAQDNDGFVSEIEAALEDVLCPSAGGCVEVSLVGGSTVSTATGIEIRILFSEVQTIGMPLDAGIDMAPVFELNLDIDPELTYGYTLDLVLGLGITEGFYLKAGGSAGDDVLQLFAGFEMANINADANLLGIGAKIEDGSARIGGNLGPDGNAGGFAISIPGQLGLRELSNRRRSVDETASARFDAVIVAHLPLTTSAADLITLHVPINLHVSASSGAGAPVTVLTLGCSATLLPEICDDDEVITLDASSIVDAVIKPVVEGLAPFNPLGQPEIKEALDTQVPILDESVRQIIGRLAEVSGYEPQWVLIQFLIDIGNLSVDDIQGEIEFGWVQVLPEFQHHPSTQPWQAQPGLGDLVSLVETVKGMGGDAAPGMVTFPVLEDPGALVSLLVGGEHGGIVTFIEFAPPPITVGPSINFSATLISLDVGIVQGNLEVELLGNIGLTAHIGFGYDSTGLKTGRLQDGLYLIDHDGLAIAVGARIQATVDGKFSVLGDVASVHFRGSGGVRLLGGLDLFDDSIALPASGRNDGRLHLHEIETIANAYMFPGLPEGLAYPCIFKLRLLFDANLSFSGKAKLLGITVFNKSFSDSWTFIDETITCSIIQKAAHIDGRTLILNGGTYADRRFDGRGDLAEHFIVRPDGPGQVAVEVRVGTSMNLITTRFRTADFDTIYAELGAGDDSVEIRPGVNRPATLYGGPGNDTLIGGNGNDVLNGGPGNDILKGTAGNNRLVGGSGNDELWAGTGRDLLEGGSGVNTYKIPENWNVAEIDDAAGQAIIDFQTSNPLTGTASFFEATVTNPSGRVLTYEIDQVMTILGGGGNDTFTINRYAPDGFVFDARGGCDTIIVPFSGVARTIDVKDSLNSNCTTLKALGTAGNDTFLFRADGPPAPDVGPVPPADRGFIAMVMPTQAVDRVNYDASISKVIVEGRGGANRFVLDDIAAPLEIEGGNGGSTFQVGQIFGTPRTFPNVAAGDEVRTRGVAGRGPMSLGVSHPAILSGGSGNDMFTVFSNVAPLTLEGISGDNTFVLRAFIVEGSVTAMGGDGNDRFEYVQNDLVSIDGGTGFNTLIIIGTELSDGFLVDDGAIEVCRQFAPGSVPDWSPVDRLPNPDDCGAIDVEFINIQSVVLHGLQGNNAFWVRSTGPEFVLRLFGGTDGATFLIGDQGDLTRIRGPVEIDGETDPLFDPRIPVPIVLPGEDATPSGPGLDPGPLDDQTNRLVVDGSAHAGGTAGTLTRDRISGLGMGGLVTIPIGDGDVREFDGGITYRTIDTATVLLGEGGDDFIVESTHTYTRAEGLTVTTVEAETVIVGGPGDEDIAVRTIDGPTTIDVSAGGANAVRVGTHAEPGVEPDGTSTLDGINGTLHIIGAEEDDQTRLVLDISGTEINSPGIRLDIDQDEVTQIEMPGEVTHQDLNLLEIYLTDGDDTVNIRRTSAVTTRIHGLGGDDRFFVSHTAEFEVEDPNPPFLDGTLDDIAGDLDIRAGGGRNLLMVSDRGSDTPITGAVLDADRMEGFAQGTIYYDAEGTFAQGITIWTGSGDDQISVAGIRRDGDPTTLAWEGRTGGGPRTITTLNTGDGDDAVTVSVHDPDHGFFVLNTGPGDDVVDGSASTLGFVVFGGDGNDRITTGAGDDIVFGDHGRIEYCTGGTLDYHGGLRTCGGLRTLLGDADIANVNDGLARAPGRMYSIESTPADTDGQPYADGGDVWSAGFNNRINVGAGDDVAWGGPGSDLITAESGRNALIGDHAEVWRRPTSSLGGTRTVSASGNFINHEVLTGEIAYVVDITHPDTGGNDVILGGDGRDWIFGGPGDDIINGGPGDDIIWGGDGHDIIWGGTGDDRIYGGNGDNVMDLKLAAWVGGVTTSMEDMDWWDLAWHVAPEVDKDGNPATHNGFDLIYGGRGRDVLQSDVGGGGNVPGDRLVDSYGPYNLFLTCSGPYGAGQVLRMPSPHILAALTALAAADGAYNVDDESSSGWRQLALVTQEHAGDNRNPPHPDHPGNNSGC